MPDLRLIEQLNVMNNLNTMWRMCPELRFCQMLEMVTGVSRHEDKFDRCIWNITDEKLNEMLLDYISRQGDALESEQSAHEQTDQH